MKKLFTRENRFLVYNAKNIVEAAGFEVVVRNEHLGGAIGEMSPIDAWVELWLVDEADYSEAKALLDNMLVEDDGGSWTCARCGEINGMAFEACWNCQHHPLDMSRFNPSSDK